MQPSDRRSTIPAMFLALLICSDEACTHELETWGTLAELAAIACDCGWALHVIWLSDVQFVEAEPPPPADAWLPLAA